MRFIAVILLSILCGCQIQKSASRPPTTPDVLIPPPLATVNTVARTLAAKAVNRVSVPVSNTVTLIWQPNYVATNEQTAIEACPDLVQQSWSTVFTGHTNQCILAKESAQQFYRAYNFLP